MNISDPIADMLTRVRNASRARHTEVVVPASRTKREIARILKDEGFIADVSEEQDGPTANLRITLKYVDGKVPVVSGLKRISKPGLRVYARKTDIPRSFLPYPLHSCAQKSIEVGGTKRWVLWW
jgi:small subunit ribosomal protein S8